MSDSSVRDDLPGVKKGDQYHHQDLREAMIQVAQELLESEGPGSWTVRAAARIAGVSSGAPYRHFADKDALLAAVAERGFDELRRQVEGRLRGLDGEALRLAALLETYVAFASARPGRYQIMFGRDLLNRRAHPELSAAADRLFSHLLCEVRAGQASGSVRADRTPDELAASLWAFVHGLSDLLLCGRVEGGDLHPVARLATLAIDGLRPQGRSAPDDAARG